MHHLCLRISKRYLLTKTDFPYLNLLRYGGVKSKLPFWRHFKLLSTRVLDTSWTSFFPTFFYGEIRALHALCYKQRGVFLPDNISETFLFGQGTVSKFQICFGLHSNDFITLFVWAYFKRYSTIVQSVKILSISDPFLYVIAWGRVKLRINITRVFRSCWNFSNFWKHKWY